MAEYDLTQKLIPHLDRHLAIPLLNHLSDVAIFPADQLAKAQYDLVKGTNMVDYVEQLHDQLKADGTSVDARDFAALRSKATSQYTQLKTQAEPVIKVIENPEAVAKLRSGVDKAAMLSEYNISAAQIDALYHFGQYQYTLGAYADAANFLYHFLIFTPSQDLVVSAHWGKLASNILTGEWEAALAEVKDLRDLIDNPHGTSMVKPLNQLQARAWLLHWSLFVFFNLPGSQGLLDMYLAPAYLNTIQTTCPHLLRYLVAASIISKTKTRELVRIVQMEDYQYNDPITAFLQDLFVDFDLSKAQERLTVAEQVVKADFFLSGFAEEFVENARWLISEVYCRIHQRIDIGALSKTLGLSGEEGEKWIVNLIRDSRVDAKIDLKANMLHISRGNTTPTATLIETTRGLAFRSQAVQYAMGRSRT